MNIEKSKRIALKLEKIELREKALEKAIEKKGPGHAWVKFLEGQIKKLKEEVGYLTDYSLKL